MQKVRLTLIIAITLFMSLGFLVAEAPADVQGKWEITIKTPGGTEPGP